jgi:hypothetical protein
MLLLCYTHWHKSSRQAFDSASGFRFATFQVACGQAWPAASVLPKTGSASHGFNRGFSTQTLFYEVRTSTVIDLIPDLVTGRWMNERSTD